MTQIRMVFRSRALQLAAVVALSVIAVSCSKEKEQKRNAASAAADKYCDCVAAALKGPAEKRSGACESEHSAWEAAWKQVPGGAEDDDKALAIMDQAHGCYQLLHQ